VREGVLLLNTMLWPDEVRIPDFGFLDEDLKVRPPELAMASSLIDSMAGEFQPDAFTDDYRAALQEVIDAKVEGREVVQPEEEEAAPAAAVDLMAALKASVERARAARGEEPARQAAEPTPISAARSAQKAAKAPAKKAAAKKAPAKKAAEKKAEPAKKAAAKKTAEKKAAKAPAKKAAEKKAAPRKTA
jgi:DNA end-binding protein Ku